MSNYSNVKTVSIDELIAILQKIKDSQKFTSIEIDECISGNLDIFVYVEKKEGQA